MASLLDYIRMQRSKGIHTEEDYLATCESSAKKIIPYLAGDYLNI